MDIQTIAGRFSQVRWRGDSSFTCSCPCHEDSRPSLTVTQKNGKLLFHCFAGCSYDDIISAVGLSPEPAGTWQRRMAYGVSGQENKEYAFDTEYRYTDEHGRYLYSKVRLRAADGGKTMRFAVIDRDSYSYDIPKERTLYNLPQLIRAVKEGYTVWYVEGEKDVETLRRLGCTAVTAGGASDWRPEYARYFKGARVNFLQDNDEAGEKLREKVVRDLMRYAFSVVWTTTSQAEHGDVTDYISEGHSMEDVKALIKQAAENGQHRNPPWFHSENDRVRVNSSLLADGIKKNEMYFILRNPTDDRDTVYIYGGGIYKPYSNNMLDGMIGEYIPSAHCTVNNIGNTRKMLLTKGGHVRSHEDVNSDERYINFKNGLYDIGSRRLLPHDPDVICTTQLDCEYDAEKKMAPVFGRFMNELCRDVNGNTDETKKRRLQEWFGLIISNIPVYRVKKCLILFSALGNTGKSQLVRLLTELLGMDNCSSVAMQQLAERFHTSYLFGKRLNAVGDQQYADIGTSSIFKQLTGGDPILCEQKGKQAFSYTYRGALVYACNDLPGFTDDKGEHLFERMDIVRCNYVVPEEERDPELLQKMLRERSAIVNWALEGLHRLIERGYRFTECRECAEVLEEYRENMDTVRRFLNSHYRITGDKTDRRRKTQLEAEYEDWCNAEGVHPVGKRNIRTRLEKNGVEYIAKYNGYPYYTGLSPLYSGTI